ncbi:RxLR effector protein [Phytophthora megakarya]|uniref:RxLR effector protein n=1 Tax=Phytophthora megakarya TaxID=4795 RepID=A0A225V4G7_9STRA|nr:RxLR effector protein [Phytophthora megakarya]
MRLLLLVLIGILYTFLLRCESASFNTTKLNPQTLLESRNDITESPVDIHKRVLRDEDGSDGEERAIGQKFSNLLKGAKTKYLTWEQKILTKRFKELAKEGKTYDDVMEDFRTRMASTGFWTTRPGFKRFARLYNTWLAKNHPDLAMKIG